MGLIAKFFNKKSKEPPRGSYASLMPRARALWDSLEGNSQETNVIRKALGDPAKAKSISIGIPDIGFKGVRQQLFQRFNLIDLYAIAHNNSVIKTATGSIKQEVFRRGLKWEPAFMYRDSDSGKDYTLEELVYIKKYRPADYSELVPNIVQPDIQQRLRFEEIMQNANVYGQSLMAILQTVEDDLNIADDGFLFLSSNYYMGWGADGKEIINRRVKQIFRMDPIFVELDMDNENRPGFAHHICLLHREDLLDIPIDEGWEDNWKGKCQMDGHTTFPVMYRYAPYRGTFGIHSGGRQGPDSQSRYLVKGEVVHASKFSPSELYGYSPILSIYEKALSLIGMDRYLYDYFFERQIPQGVITTVTDNPEDLEVRKEQLLSEVLNNPHYIPWLAVSSRTGQGETKFVRFAYSLDELQFLPVQESIERSVSSLYGVPGLFMGYEKSMGGLNNESQQLIRLSRGAQLSQSVYNSSVFPALLDAFGITDWTLELETSEEQSEKFLLELKQMKATWASGLATMGFGVKYDQKNDEYEVYGEVKPRSEQEAGWSGGGGDMGMGAGAGEEEELSPELEIEEELGAYPNIM